ncbi:alpha-xylosidase, family GH31 [Zostera marina]|uniref:Alpha-xylosidase, family GH31 n=1 Tax=Zostera marina TaxID=29655 RepID=A0A0K9P2Y8_ZOSMR|nr:alpha-xylosidase, family GH31 [Zostera marina]
MLLPTSSSTAVVVVFWFASVLICCFPRVLHARVGYGYSLSSLKELPDGGGLLGYLQIKTSTTTYGSDVPNLKLFVKHESGDRLRIHITDADKERWEVPYDLLPREKVPGAGTGREQNHHEYTGGSGTRLVFGYTNDPFGFSVRRKSDGEVLFNSSSSSSSSGDLFGPMVFKDQYLEISTTLPASAALYGLGENTQPGGIRIRPNDPYTLYTNDVSAIKLNTDLYGSHPFYMDVRKIGGEGASAHGVLLLNSNGMDVFYRGDSLTYKIIGGVFDFYFFAGTTPLEVVDQYTTLIGRPAAMPYWAFGFHQCRWGYKNLSVVEAVVEGYRQAKIPLDVIWNDDDHMIAHRDFTLNPVNYPRPKLLEFLTKIHALGMKYIVINDPGIAVDPNYDVYRRAMEQDIFIKHDGKPYLAQVWPGPVYFPDFLNPRSASWWIDEIERFHRLVPIDGLWIDMNEASNFCTGDCKLPTTHSCPIPGNEKPWICCLDCKNITNTRWDDPPYKINVSGIGAPLGYKTIATSAEHYNGILEYNAHSIYGLSEAVVTHRALQGLKGKRPFVLTRSTFVGSGKYAAHWTGDNQGDWKNLRYSISTMLNYGMFGMPMVGSDICGFYPQPTEELCNRWIQLGAFYPFSRDHANFHSPRQELYVWNTVAESARNALGLRYKLLPYLYTLNYDAHVSGAPLARPVFFSFPNFTKGYELTTQFLLGESIMVSPVLKKQSTVVKVLFPPGSWYNMFDMTKVVLPKDDRYITLDAPWNEINVHLYQNTIIPMQEGGLRSKDARKTPFTIVVAFPLKAETAEAVGKVFVDDDESTEMELADGKSTLVVFRASLDGGKVRVWSDVKMGAFAREKGFIIGTVRVLGLESTGISNAVEIKIDGEVSKDIENVRFVSSGLAETTKLEGDTKKRVTVVDVTGLGLPLGKKFSMTWQMGVQ